MPLVKKIIKADPREVIVKWVGTGTDTLTLASLVSTGQTVTGTVATAAVITAVSASMDGAGTCAIVRNAEEVLHVHDNFEFQTDGIIQAVLDENSTFPIVVTLSTTGTLIMRVRKSQGYSDV